MDNNKTISSKRKNLLRIVMIAIIALYVFILLPYNPAIIFWALWQLFAISIYEWSAKLCSAYVKDKDIQKHYNTVLLSEFFIGLFLSMIGGIISTFIFNWYYKKYKSK